MRLNGWQYLWLAAGAVWLLIVGVTSYVTRPVPPSLPISLSLQEDGTQAYVLDVALAIAFRYDSQRLMDLVAADMSGSFRGLREQGWSENQLLRFAQCVQEGKDEAACRTHIAEQFGGVQNPRRARLAEEWEKLSQWGPNFRHEDAFSAATTTQPTEQPARHLLVDPTLDRAEPGYLRIRDPAPFEHAFEQQNKPKRAQYEASVRRHITIAAALWLLPWLMVYAIGFAIACTMRTFQEHGEE